MKKQLRIQKRYIVLCIVLLFCITGDSIVMNNRKKVKENSEKNEIWQPIRQEVGGIMFEIDPKLELLEIIYDLSIDQGNPVQLINDYDSEYRKSVEEYFATYSKEEAVSVLIQYVNTWQNIASPYELFYLLNDDFTLPDDLPDNVTEPFRGTDEISKFLDECIEFAQKTDYLSFFHSQESYFKDRIREGADLVDDDMLSRFTTYYGIPDDSYQFTIVLIPLRVSGGFGILENMADGRQQITSLIAPESEENYFTESGVQELVWHEFGHSFINPLTSEKTDIVKACEPAYATIVSEMNRNGYGDLNTCINEHIIRAIVARLVLDDYGESESEIMLSTEEANGFKYIRPLYEKLEDYEENREVYSTIDDFYPELLKVFRP